MWFLDQCRLGYSIENAPKKTRHNKQCKNIKNNHGARVFNYYQGDCQAEHLAFACNTLPPTERYLLTKDYILYKIRNFVSKNRLSFDLLSRLQVLNSKSCCKYHSGLMSIFGSFATFSAKHTGSVEILCDKRKTQSQILTPSVNEPQQ